MLVLTRKKDQAVIINQEVKIKVLRINGNSVRIGIEAPDEYRILRGELNEWREFSFDVTTESTAMASA